MSQEEKTTEVKVYKSMAINYMTDGNIEVLSTGEQELPEEIMYDHIIKLADIIKEKRQNELIYTAAMNGAKQVFAEMAQLKMSQENQNSKAATEE